MSSPTEDDAATAPSVAKNKRGSVELTAPIESSVQAVGDPLQEHTSALLDLLSTTAVEVTLTPQVVAVARSALALLQLEATGGSQPRHFEPAPRPDTLSPPPTIEEIDESSPPSHSPRLLGELPAQIEEADESAEPEPAPAPAPEQPSSQLIPAEMMIEPPRPRCADSGNRRSRRGGSNANRFSVSMRMVAGQALVHQATSKQRLKNAARAAQPWTAFVTGVACVLYCLIYPFQVAFEGAVCFDERSDWATTYLVFDTVLLLDMVVRAVPADDSAPEDEARNGGAEQRRRRLRLALDLVTRFPLWLFVPSECGGAGSGFQHASLARGLLVFVGLQMAQNSINDYLPAISRRRARAEAVVAFAIAMLVLHWFACLEYAVSWSVVDRHVNRLNRGEAPPPLATWIVSEGLIDVDMTTTAAIAGGGGNLGIAEIVLTRAARSRYARSLQRGVLVMLGDGVDSESDEELLLTLAGMLLGIVCLALFTANLIELVAASNEYEREMRHKIGRVTAFMRNATLPRELQWRVQAHLAHVLLHKKLSVDTELLLQDLSPALKSEISLHRSKQLVQTMLSRLLQGSDVVVEPSFVKALVHKLRIVVFSPGDMVMEEGDAAETVYFISTGCVAIVVGSGPERHKVADRTSGACLGEIALLTGGRRSASCIATTFTEAFYLSCDDFSTCLRDFPDIAARIRMLAIARVQELQSSMIDRSMRNSCESKRGASTASDLGQAECRLSKGSDDPSTPAGRGGASGGSSSDAEGEGLQARRAQQSARRRSTMMSGDHGHGRRQSSNPGPRKGSITIIADRASSVMSSAATQGWRSYHSGREMLPQRCGKGGAVHPLTRRGTHSASEIASMVTTERTTSFDSMRLSRRLSRSSHPDGGNSSAWTVARRGMGPSAYALAGILNTLGGRDDRRQANQAAANAAAAAGILRARASSTSTAASASCGASWRRRAARRGWWRGCARCRRSYLCIKLSYLWISVSPSIAHPIPSVSSLRTRSYDSFRCSPECRARSQCGC